MITFSTALDQVAYESLRYTIIKNAEGIKKSILVFMINHDDNL